MLVCVCYRRRAAIFDEPQAYLHDSPRLPIYCQVSKLLSTSQCVNALLDPELKSDVVCGYIPFGVNCNSSFIVDMNRLSHPKDILCDDMGVWKWNGSYRSWLAVNEQGEVKVLGKSLSGAPSSTQYRIWKRYYHNKSSPDVKKMVVFLEGEIIHCGVFLALKPCLIVFIKGV